MKYQKQKINQILFGTLLLILFAGCAGIRMMLQPPDVSLVNIVPIQFTLFEQRYRLQLRIQNPNEDPLPIRGMKYKVYLNEQEFAHGVSRQPVTVPAFGEALFDVEVTSDLGGVLKQIGELSKGERKKFKYRLAGGIKIAHQPVSLPFSYKGEIDLDWAAPSGH